MEPEDPQPARLFELVIAAELVTALQLLTSSEEPFLWVGLFLLITCLLSGHSADKR